MEAEGEDGGLGSGPSGQGANETCNDQLARKEGCRDQSQTERHETTNEVTHTSKSDNSGEKLDDVKRNADASENNINIGKTPEKRPKGLDGLRVNVTSSHDGSANGKRKFVRSPNDTNGKRRRHRRKHKGGKHHHRKWKPYDKLTWEEKKVLEERESKRACKKRENQFASGQAMAPYNTTQFLMEQHEPEESEMHINDSMTRHRTQSHRADEHHNGSGSGSAEGSSDDYYDSNDDEEIFLERDFTNAYEQYQAERLQGMTKEELVREYLGMEGEVEALKRQLKEVNRRYSSESNNGSLPQTPLVGLQSPLFDEKSKQLRSLSLQSEIQKLQEENMQLLHENKKLRLKRTGSENDIVSSTGSIN